MKIRHLTKKNPYGQLWLLTEVKFSIEITGFPKIHDSGQGGLLDIALPQSLQKISLSISLLRTKLDVVNFNVWVSTTLYYVYSVEN